MGKNSSWKRVLQHVDMLSVKLVIALHSGCSQSEAMLYDGSDNVHDCFCKTAT